VMGVGEGIFCMERWVLCAGSESWNAASGAGDVVCGD